jgi:hypothetical protein
MVPVFGICIRISAQYRPRPERDQAPAVIRQGRDGRDSGRPIEEVTDR